MSTNLALHIHDITLEMAINQEQSVESHLFFFQIS